MKYLLDVNALLALGHLQHVFHTRVANWIGREIGNDEFELATCPIVELGFVRVLGQAPQYGFTVIQAKSLLVKLRKSNSVKFGFIADDHDISRLPSWVNTPRKITDGHLAELARRNRALLATLDEDIPGAFVIPY